MFFKHVRVKKTDFCEQIAQFIMLLKSISIPLINDSEVILPVKLMTDVPLVLKIFVVT